jgi:TonB family protein
MSARAFRVLLAVALLSLRLFPGSRPFVSQEPAKLVDPKAGPAPTLEQIAEKLTVRAAKLGCTSNDCALSILNFASASGSTEMVDIKLADELASIFARTLLKGKVIDRSAVREFLAQERIPYNLLTSHAARRWLGQELGATTVVAGDLNVSGPVPQAMFTVFDVTDPDKIEYFGTELPVTAYSPGDLQPAESFASHEMPKTTNSGAIVYRAGVDGVGSPSCDYMPNPQYTEAAREAKISGTILLDVIVTPEGTMESPRVGKGLPGGLNEEARNTLLAWRCKPAMKDKVPVATVVQLEVNFRLGKNP